MGVLANHVPAIEQLKPGVVEVVEESGGPPGRPKGILSLPSKQQRS